MTRRSSFSVQSSSLCKRARCSDLNMAYQPALPIVTSSLSSPNMSEEKHQVESEESSPVEAREEGEGVINEKKLLRKIDLHILPGLAVLLLLSALDQSNGELLPCFMALPSTHLFSVGNARIEGLIADTHMSACSPRCPRCVSASLIMIQNKLETSSSGRWPPSTLAISYSSFLVTSSSSSRLRGSGFRLSLLRGVSPAPSRVSPKILLDSSLPAYFWVWQKAGTFLESRSI